MMSVPEDGEGRVRTQVDVLIYALLEAANDKHDDVQQAVTKSLVKLGYKKPELMLGICFEYLQTHGKLPPAHRTIVLRAMAEVCRSCVDVVDSVLAKNIIKQCVEEMVGSKDVVPEWQGAACSVLVALGQRFCYEVMDCLHMKFQPGVIPHFFVVQALGDLAVSNAFGMVPFMKAILQTTLTIIGLVKHDNMKWVFAHVLARFSEAIMEYIANIEKAPDPSVKKEFFSTELSVAYSTMFNSWLQSKEPKVRIAVVEAIGYISQLFSKDKLEEEIPRLIPGILTLYKRHPEPYFISQGLSMLLSSAVTNKCSIIEIYFDSVLNCLFPQICCIPDYSLQMAVKNHNEVLRCFTVLSEAHSERMISFLLQRVDNNNENVRIGSLTVLRHLINSPESHISDKIATVISGLKCALTEPVNKVKKVLAHVIVALAHHGYLELDSSQAMTEFIIQQCALPDEPEEKRSDINYVSNFELRSMCENILHLLATTVERMSMVFWPHVLEFLIPEHLTNAVGVVCKSATYLGTRKKDEHCTDYEVDFEKHKNLPHPIHLIARLLVLLGHPNVGNKRGIHILHLMKILVPSLEKNLIAAWDAGIPKLLQNLEDDQWSRKHWEQQVLKFLADSLGEVDRQEWTVLLGKTFGEQMHLYSQYPDEKNFLLKCIGVVLSKSASKTLVNDLLDLIFKNVNHAVETDREGCAAALGRCAATHMDAVLVKLDHIARGEHGKKSGLFSFIMDIKGELEHEIWKATIVLSYGYVAICSPPSLLTARIESPILRNANQYFSLAKEPTIRASLICMTEMIARALHPTNLRERIAFRSKGELLKHMENFILAEKGARLTSATCALAMNACTALLKLDPVLMCDERLPLLKTCYDSVFPLPDRVEKGIEKMELCEDTSEYEELLQTTLDSLEALLKELLLQDITSSNMYSLFVSLEPWLMSSHTFERERSMHCVLILARCFLDHMPIVISGSTCFDSHGAIIARLVPRCTDPSTIVRELALESIGIILKTVSRYEGFSVDHTDPEIELLHQLQSQAAQSDPDVLYSITSQLAKALSSKLSLSQLRQFLDVLMEGLVDAQDHSSSGTCVVLNNVLKSKAGVLHQEMETLIQLLHSRLSEITCTQTRRGTLQIIRTLAGFHLKSVLSSLLAYPLPYDKHVSDWWRVLAIDPQLSCSITEQFCEILMRGAPYTEHPDPRNKKDIIRIAAPKALAVICAFREMFCVPEMEKTAQKEFDKLFVCLLALIGCYVNVFPPSVIQENPKDPNAKAMIVIHSKHATRIVPSRVGMDTMHAFLLCTKSEHILKDIGEDWDLLDSKVQNPSVVANFAKALAVHYQRHLPGVVTCFNPMLSSVYDSQRIVAVAFFAELINHHRRLDQTALELLLNSMLGRLVDGSHIVRRLAIRGLGSIGKLDVEHLDTLEWFGVYKYSNTVLSAMMGGLDDKDDPDGAITLESMKGLCRVLADMDESHVESAVISIALRVRPCFEKERAEIRAAAFNLFGMLARFGKGSSENAFHEQLHNNLVSLLLHLNDENKDVIKACKGALRAIGPSLGSVSINNMFQKHLLVDSQLYYREFMGDLSKIMTVDFSDKVSLYITTCMAYFKSSWPIIKANAAMFTGLLLGNIPDEFHPDFKDEAVFGALTLLLKDSTSEVRIKAAEAISVLHNY